MGKGKNKLLKKIADLKSRNAKLISDIKIIISDDASASFLKMLEYKTYFEILARLDRLIWVGCETNK